MAKPKPRYTERDKRLPNELIGVEGVRRFHPSINPRLNPRDWRIVINPAGFQFAVKRQETDDLSIQQRADLGIFDRRTQAQQARMQQAYDRLAADSRADAKAGSDALNALAAGAGEAFSGTPLTGPRSSAERAREGQLARASQESTVAENVLPIDRLNRTPSLMAAHGQSAIDAFATDAEANRMQLMDAWRQQNAAALAQARQEQLEAQRAQQELALQLRGQNLDLIGQQIAGQSRLQVAQVGAEQKALDREARLRIEAAKLENAARIARENNETRRAIALEKAAAGRRNNAQKLRRESLSEGMKIARGMAEKTAIGQQNGETLFRQYTPVEIYKYLTGSGYPGKMAGRIVKAVTGKNPHLQVQGNTSILGGTTYGFSDSGAPLFGPSVGHPAGSGDSSTVTGYIPNYPNLFLR